MSIMANPELKLNHLQAMMFFTLVVSVAFGFLSRRSAYQRARYIVWSLVLFLLAGIGIGWLMYPFSR
jgi:cytochrome bd-type quinol oxidase subunit 2